MRSSHPRATISWRALPTCRVASRTIGQRRCSPSRASSSPVGSAPHRRRRRRRRRARSRSACSANQGSRPCSPGRPEQQIDRHRRQVGRLRRFLTPRRGTQGVHEAGSPPTWVDSPMACSTADSRRSTAPLRESNSLSASARADIEPDWSPRLARAAGTQRAQGPGACGSYDQGCQTAPRPSAVGGEDRDSRLTASDTVFGESSTVDGTTATQLWLRRYDIASV